MRPARIFIMYGQYGIGAGMNVLAQYLAPYGRVTMHQWNDEANILALARAFLAPRPDGVVIIIGYSLGANCAPYYGAMLPQCDLTISYDPSIYSPLVANGIQSVSPKIKLGVCFQNTAAWLTRGGYGGAALRGANVVTHKFQAFHLNVPGRTDLHMIAKGHVKAAVEGSTVVAAH